MGAGNSENRLLNEGRPLNFILSDPTQMRYIDPPLALHNQGALELAEGRVLPGLFLRRRKWKSIFFP